MADPRFPGLGVEGRWRQPSICHNFCQKLHENEKNWTERGHPVSHAPRSATDSVSILIHSL